MPDSIRYAVVPDQCRDDMIADPRLVEDLERDDAAWWRTAAGV